MSQVRELDLPESQAERIELHESAAIQGDGFEFWRYILESQGIRLNETQRCRLSQLTNEHLRDLAGIMNEAFYGAMIVYPEEVVMSYFGAEINAFLEGSQSHAVVILDRMIYRAVIEMIDKTNKDRIHYLSLTRRAGDLFDLKKRKMGARIGDLPIDQQLGTLKKKLNGHRVAFVDDCFVSGGSESRAMALLDSIGVHILPPEKNIFFSRVVRAPEAPWEDRPRSAVLNIKSFLSAEQREGLVLGGAPVKSNKKNSSGYQEPLMHPFSDANGLRLGKRLEAREISKKILELDIWLLEGLEEIKGQPVLIQDVKEMIPTDSSKELIRQYIRSKRPDSEEETDISIKEFFWFVRRAELLDFVRFALSKLEKQEKKEIQTVCLDLDGTVAKLVNTEGKVGFRGSVLEKEVYGNVHNLVKEAERLKGNNITSKEATQILDGIDTEIGIADFFVQEYGEILERHFGDECRREIERRFQNYYGQEEGSAKAKEFLVSQPLAYHVFRMKTWDHDLPAIYEFNIIAREVCEKIKEAKGEIIFITAAPRIHAEKMLDYLGLREATDGRYKMFTVEDLYHSDTFNEQNKGVILQRLIDQGRTATKMVMIGDQIKSDIRPAEEKGVWTFLIKGRGPEDLRQLLSLIKLPGDSNVGSYPDKVRDKIFNREAISQCEN